MDTRYVLDDLGFHWTMLLKQHTGHILMISHFSWGQKSRAWSEIRCRFGRVFLIIKVWLNRTDLSDHYLPKKTQICFTQCKEWTNKPWKGRYMVFFGQWWYYKLPKNDALYGKSSHFHVEEIPYILFSDIINPTLKITLKKKHWLTFNKSAKWPIEMVHPFFMQVQVNKK